MSEENNFTQLDKKSTLFAEKIIDIKKRWLDLQDWLNALDYCVPVVISFNTEGNQYIHLRLFRLRGDWLIHGQISGTEVATGMGWSHVATLPLGDMINCVQAIPALLSCLNDTLLDHHNNIDRASNEFDEILSGLNPTARRSDGE